MEFQYFAISNKTGTPKPIDLFRAISMSPANILDQALPNINQKAEATLYCCRELQTLLL